MTICKRPAPPENRQKQQKQGGGGEGEGRGGEGGGGEEEKEEREEEEEEKDEEPRAWTLISRLKLCMDHVGQQHLSYPKFCPWHTSLQPWLVCITANL